MSKANQNARFFSRRGQVKKEIEYKGEKINITINIPNNFQHDALMESYTDMNDAGASIRGAELIEARLIQNIIELPFEVPRTENIDGDYVSWEDATDTEKSCAVRIMDTELRELINNCIVGESALTEDEVGN